MAAADVNDVAHPREIVCGGEAGRERCRPFRHRGLKTGRLSRAGYEKVDPPLARGEFQPRFAGQHRVQDAIDPTS